MCKAAGMRTLASSEHVVLIVRSDLAFSFLLLLPNIRKTLLEIRNQILAFGGNVNRLFLTAFRTNPRGQLLGRSMNKPALAGDRHPLVLPALSHRWCLAQEFCDLSPAFQ